MQRQIILFAGTLLTMVACAGLAVSAQSNGPDKSKTAAAVPLRLGGQISKEPIDMLAVRQRITANHTPIRMAQFDTPGCTPGPHSDCDAWGNCLEEARAKLRDACINNPPQTESKWELCSAWLDSFNAEIDKWNNHCASSR